MTEASPRGRGQPERRPTGQAAIYSWSRPGKLALIMGAGLAFQFLVGFWAALRLRRGL
jgi:hypothetical protein